MPKKKFIKAEKAEKILKKDEPKARRTGKEVRIAMYGKEDK